MIDEFSWLQCLHLAIEFLVRYTGCALEDRRSASGLEIGSEEDLIKLGMQQLPKVEALLRDTLDTLQAPRRRKLVAMLDALRALS